MAVINTDEATIDIDERAARVPRIDRGIGLNKIFVTLDIGKDPDVTTLRTDDPARNRFADPKGIANGKHAVAHFDLGRVRKGDGRKVFRFDLDYCDVGLFVTTDDLTGKLPTIGQRHGDGDGAIDNVVVGCDVAVLANDHARAESALRYQANFGSATLPIEARKSVGSLGDLSSRDLGGDLYDARRDALDDIGKRSVFQLAAGCGLRVPLQRDRGIGVLSGLETG